MTGPRRTAHPATTFQAAYGITRTAADDWFDPTLHTDTPLFVDPFLMFDEKAAPWSNAEQALVQFFNEVMLRIAGGRGGSVKEQVIAASMLSFPEPAAFCLGYGDKTILGSGSGSGMGKSMLKAGNDAISAGINNISDFGELLLFGAGMGSDRISDLVCNVLLPDLINYTQGVAKRHGLALTQFLVPHAGYDFARHRWRDVRVQLPQNPCWTKTPVLLVPERFLDDLPGLDDDEFWDWVYDSHNEQLRTDLGILIADKLNRHQIIALAKRRSTLRAKYGPMYADALRKNPPIAYDTQNDPKLLVTPKRAAVDFSAQSTVEPPSSPSDFIDYIFSLAEDFKRLVEDSGLWRALWNGNQAMKEALAQQLFRASVTAICKDRNIDVSPEANAGVGPVDFKFSQGWERRSIVELKLASSSSFLNNVQEQPPAYMRAEGISCGVILVIQYEDVHCSDEFISKANEAVKKVADERSVDYRIVFVDARQKKSASKRKPGDT